LAELFKSGNKQFKQSCGYGTCGTDEKREGNYQPAFPEAVAAKNDCPLNPVTAEMKKETFHLKYTLF
jgi:hypothetical protein